VYAETGRKLIEGLRNPTIVRDQAALQAFSIRPRGLSEAIRRALSDDERLFDETRWSEVYSTDGVLPQWDGKHFAGRVVDSRTVEVDVPAEKAFEPIQRIGGPTGWYYGKPLWRIRGLLDRLVGGVGLRPGRRDPVDLHVGDPIDFWRVDEYEPPRRLRLRAEMRLPGRAWQEFEVVPREKGATIRQTAIFEPRGLAGVAYWYGLYPLHQLLFAGMLEGIAREARRHQRHA